MRPEDLPEDADIVGEFGNSYLLDDGDTTHTVPRTAAYELSYIHGHADLVFGDAETPPTIFEGGDGEPTVAVRPTDSQRVFTLRVDDRKPVQNPPADRDRVLSGVREIVAADGRESIVHLYEELSDAQADADLLQNVQRRYAPVPPASIQHTDDGWVVEDLFLLTWLGSVYLVTRNFDQATYHVGGGISRSDEDVEFIGLTPRGDPEDVAAGLDLTVDGESIGANEMEFLWKAYWLATYRDRHDDDLFWDLIERHVQTTRAAEQQRRHD